MLTVDKVFFVKANTFTVYTPGLERYIDIGVPADRLVLGVPWYGYNYPCLAMSEVR